MKKLKTGIADYVLITEKLEGEKSPRLGVRVEEKDKGLEIMGVSHKSPAKKAGLQAGRCYSNAWGSVNNHSG